MQPYQEYGRDVVLQVILARLSPHHEIDKERAVVAAQLPAVTGAGGQPVVVGGLLPMKEADNPVLRLGEVGVANRLGALPAQHNFFNCFAP